MYYLENLDVTIVDQMTGISESCECLSVKTHIEGYGKLYICCIYRPPHKSVPLFLDSLEQKCEFLSTGKSIVVGDINIDISQRNNSVSHYTDIVTSFGFVNEITLNTYVSPIMNEEKSLLDHVWHNLNRKCESLVIRPALADHLAICSVFDIKMLNRPVKVKFRNFSDSNVNCFKASLSAERERFLLPLINADNHAEYLVKFFNDFLNKYFPIKTKELNDKRMSNRIIKCIDKKHSWYKMVKRGIIVGDSYRKYCYALRELLRMAEEDYYRCRLGSLSRDQKKNWKVVNSLMGKKSPCISRSFLVNGIETSDPLVIANKFNDYFVQHPRYLHDSLLPSDRDYSHIIPIAAGL